MKNGQELIGKLIVVEGPEGTGKTSLAEALSRALVLGGLEAEYMSFPGRGTSSIGAIVYRIEHQPESLGISPASPVARQALHLAAHLDAIAARIKPALAAGRWVVLDRYWWSMWAHGTAQGVSNSLLRNLIAAEKEEWGDCTPLFVLTTFRDAPFNELLTPEWSLVAKAYDALAHEQAADVAIEHLRPEANLRERVETCLAKLRKLGFIP